MASPNMLEMPYLDASRLTGRLYQGGAPDPGAPRLSGFDTVVLMAKEYQPADRLFDGVEVLRLPINDDLTPMTLSQLRRVHYLGAQVCHRLRQGKKVLVTCAAGLNRSGLISALAIRKCTGRPQEEIIDLIRRRRRPRALSNPYFAEIVRQSP